MAAVLKAIDEHQAPKRWTRIFATLRGLAPYAVIELLLPGGSLIALALWFYRRHNAASPPLRPR
jgi:hypothetical protein